MNSRRSFLRTTAATAAGLAFPTIIPARVLAASPNGKVRHAAIGCSNQAWSDLQVLAGSGKIEVVALCDTKADRLAAAAEIAKRDTPTIVSRLLEQIRGRAPPALS